MDVLFAASPSGCGGSAKTASTVTAMNDTNKMATSGSFLTATWRNGNGMLGCRGGFSHGIASMEMSADDFLPSPSQHLFPTISTNDYGIASINRSESPLTLDTSSSFVSEHSTERGTENVFRSTNSALESTMPFAPSGIANPHYGYAWTHEISTHSHSLGRGKANPPSGGKRVGMETSHASSSPFLSASFKPGGGEHSSRSHCATRETTTSLTDHRTLSHHSLYLGATRPFYSDPSSASTNVVTSSLVVEDTYSN